MSHHHPSFQTRRRRRLPHVQRATRSRPPGTFWLTYSRAVDWLRRNHGIIDKTLELLDIYPTLIQEMSLDGLWDFLAPFVTKAVDKSATKARPLHCGQGSDKDLDSFARPGSHFGTAAGRASLTMNSRSGSGSGRGSHKTLTQATDVLQVPVISITYASDDQEPELQALSPGPLGDGDSFGNRTPRVYLCCLCRKHPTGEEKLHRHVLHALQHDFFVRSGPCAEESFVVYWDDISEADLCVFLLDDLSLNTSTCFKSLCAAHSMNTPIVFLKDSKYSLPVPLPDVILQHNLGLESPELSRASTPVCPRRSNTSDLSRHSKRTTVPETRSSSTTGFEEKSHQRAKQNLEQSDMVLCLLNGYRNALVFEEDRHQECEKELRETVHKLLGTGRNEVISRNSSSSPVSKSSNTLHPNSRKASRTKPAHRASLGVPKLRTNDFLQQEASASGLSDYASDEENDFPFVASPNEMTIDIPCDSNGSVSPSRSFLSPHTYVHTNCLPTPVSCLNSPPPKRSASVGFSSSHPPSPSVTPSGSRSSSSRSFVHLHQFQQQLQQDRALFLSSVSPFSNNGGEAGDSLQERQTVYLVCDKPKEQPRLVKFPPSANEDDEGKAEVVDMFSDTSDSPLSFKNVDLSALVNKSLRGADTPDSDASTLF